jgi:hypothetical protein
MLGMTIGTFEGSFLFRQAKNDLQINHIPERSGNGTSVASLGDTTQTGDDLAAEVLMDSGCRGNPRRL